MIFKRKVLVQLFDTIPLLLKLVSILNILCQCEVVLTLALLKRQPGSYKKEAVSQLVTRGSQAVTRNTHPISHHICGCANWEAFQTISTPII